MTDDPRRDSKPVLIIQCGRAKQGAPRDGKQYPASELYTGSLWKTYRANNKPDLNPTPHHLYIISAKYGLIRGDDLIPHYDEEMTLQRAKDMRYKLCIQIGLEGLDQVDPERIFYVGGIGSKKNPSPYLTALRGAGLSFTPLTEVYKEPGKRGGVGVNLSALKKFLQRYRRCVDQALLKAAKADRQVLTQQIAIENKRADLDFTEWVASVADWSHPQQRMDMGLQAGLGCRDLIHFIGDPDDFMASDPFNAQVVFPVVESTWLSQQPVNYFKRFEYFSGSNSAGTFRAVLDAGRFPGVAINSCGRRSQCFQGFKTLRPGLHAFIDSGAFTEWSTKTVVSDDSWVARYKAMAELAGALGYRASIVMPDKVGDEVETTRRQKVLASLVQQIEASGAELLLPLQKDSKKHVDGRRLIRSAARNMGVPEHRLVPSIPMPAEMWSDDQIVRLAQSLPGDRIHLLGISEKESRPLTMAILAARPDMKVSSDSKKTTLGVGWGTGGRPAKKTLRRVRSLAQRIDPEVMMLGYVGASDELDKPKVRQHLVDALGGRQRAIEWLAGAAKSSEMEAGKFLDGKPTSLPWSYIVSTAVDEIPLAQLKARRPFGRGATSLTGAAMTYWSQLEPMIEESTEAAPFNWSFVLQADGSMFPSADKMLDDTSRALKEEDPRLTDFGAEELVRYALNHPALSRHFLSEQAGVSFDDFIDYMATFSDDVYRKNKKWNFVSVKIKNTHPANDPTWRVQAQIS
jgi:hypothetical protein